MTDFSFSLADSIYGPGTYGSRDEYGNWQQTLADKAPHNWFTYVGMIQLGYLSPDGILSFSRLNQSIKSIGKLNPVKIDKYDNASIMMAFYLEQILPTLINQNWLTYNQSRNGYDLTYAGKGLDHTVVWFGEMAFSDPSFFNTSLTVTDWILYNSVSPVQNVLNIPQGQIDSLKSLLSNISGAQASSALKMQIGQAMVFAAVSAGFTAGVVSALMSPAVQAGTATGNASALAPVAGETSPVGFAGSGTLTSSVQAGSVAGSIADNAPLVFTGPGSIAGSLEAGSVASSIAGGTTGASLFVTPAVNPTTALGPQTTQPGVLDSLRKLGTKFVDSLGDDLITSGAGAVVGFLKPKPSSGGSSLGQTNQGANDSGISVDWVMAGGVIVLFIGALILVHD